MFNLSTRPGAKIGIEMSDYCQVAQRLRMSVAKIRGVDEIESAGSGFLTSSNRPKILFEGHLFYRDLRKKGLAVKAQQLAPSICYPSWTKQYYIGREGEYGRLAKATEICHKFDITDAIALRAASWGRYQILGSNFIAAGFDTVEAFVEAMFLDEDNHLEAFAEYIVAEGIDDELRIGNTIGFVSRYNGPGYARNNYHIKLPNAIRKFERQNVDCRKVLAGAGHVVALMPGIRDANPPAEGFANTGFDDRYLTPDNSFLVTDDADFVDLFNEGASSSPATQFGLAAAEPAILREDPASSVADPAAGADDGLAPEKAPASPDNVETELKRSETVDTPQGEKTVSQTTTLPAGDAPDVPPTSWFSVEDWKPAIVRWLGRTWKAIVPANLAQSGGFTMAALNDMPNWYIYLAIAAVIAFLLCGVGAIISIILVVIWLWNRGEISEAKLESKRIAANPNLKNVGVIVERK